MLLKLNKMIRNIFYILLCWVFLSNTLFYSYAQNLRFRHLNADQGLSHNTITCFLQDSQGYVWIGTQDGLNRYNTYSFEIYKHDTKNSYTLANNYINALAEDQNKTIWVGTAGGGLHHYDPRYNRFVRNQEVEQKMVHALWQDSESVFWVAAGNLLYYFDKKTKKFTPYPAFSNWELMCIEELSPQELLIGSFGGGLFHLNLKTKKNKQYAYQEDKPESVCYKNITSLCKDSKNNIWVGTEKGLDKFLPEKGVFEHITIKENSNPKEVVPFVKSIIEKGNSVWFATENMGLNHLDLENMRFQSYLPNAEDAESINDFSIWTLYLDRQDRLWVGTFSGGVNISDKYSKKFLKPNIILKNQTVNALLKDSKNRIWIGTEGGLAVQDGNKTRYYTHDTNNTNSLGNNPVLAIYEDTKNRIWIGTWGERGLSLFDETKKQFRNFKTLANIFSIRQSQETGQMLIASFGGGFNILLTEEPEKFKTFTTTTKNAISNDLARVIYEDKQHNIWIGTTVGLNKFDMRTQKITQFIHNEQDTTSISENTINCFLEDSQGRFWIGTNDGLNLMIEGNKFQSHITRHALPSKSINGLLEDKKGNLWISTNKGIVVFNPQTRDFRNYDKSDGLPSNLFKPHSFCKGADGEFFFGGTNGYTAFFPEKINENPHLPPVVLTGLRLFNKPVQIGAEDSILKQSLSQTKEITFTHNQSVFSFDFVALNFTVSEKNQYAYKLEPFEKDWNYVGNRNEATYTNLDAGTYIFRVKASNHDGAWNEEGTNITVTVLPAWWETWWFRTFVIAFFLVGGIAFYKIRMGVIKRQNRILEEKVKSRTKEIERQGEALQAAYEEIQVTNEELHQTQEEITAQRDWVLHKNEELEAYSQKISKSIESALLIQKAILPTKDKLDYLLKAYFILYRPKDVVSGDFYWATKIDKHKFLIVADCTGHGVSGAFMTMIGSALLDRIIKMLKIQEPHLILEALHEQIQVVLQQEQTRNTDGMDILVVKWEENKNEILMDFAAAKRPLYLYNPTEKKIQKIKGSRKSIGGLMEGTKSFENISLVLPKNTIIYMGSDGYADQNDKDRKSFSEKSFEAMLSIIQDKSLEEQKVFLEQTLDNHKAGVEQRDDILVVGVRL
jgi:ligand-binding sensor domain-containing protein/serine phosphatase RsbU (regulator of sigma subunit)